MNPIGVMILIGLFVLWSQFLLKLAKSRKDNRKEFYLLLFAPFIISMIVGLLNTEIMIAIKSNLLWFYVFSIVMLIYNIGWSKIVYKLASDEKMLWFYATLLFSPLWIVYIALEEI